MRRGRVSSFPMNNGKHRQPASPLIGQLFHSVDPKTGQIEWQGEVVGELQPGWYLVQIFDWIAGEPSVRRIVPMKSMVHWLFYPNREAAIYSWTHGTAHPGSKYQKLSSRPELAVAFK